MIGFLRVFFNSVFKIRTKKAELQFEIEGKRYYSFYECDNKKMTQKKTAFDIVVKLYKDKKIEPNTGRRNWGDGPSGNVLGGAMFPPPTQYLSWDSPKLLFFGNLLRTYAQAWYLVCIFFCE